MHQANLFQTLYMKRQFFFIEILKLKNCIRPVSGWFCFIETKQIKAINYIESPRSKFNDMKFIESSRLSQTTNIRSGKDVA